MCVTDMKGSELLETIASILPLLWLGELVFIHGVLHQSQC
jgi:hypothetical protein